MSDTKRQKLADRATFLGLDHDVSKALEPGSVTLWLREGLILKIVNHIRPILAEGRCSPGAASKWMGILGFTSTGIFGKVGRGALSD